MSLVQSRQARGLGNGLGASLSAAASVPAEAIPGISWSSRF